MFRTRFGHWLEGARPHTWANAFAPVIAGTGAAVHAGSFNIVAAAYAAVVSWLLIVGVNYANDYSDGIRGTDNNRQGPLRLVGAGLARPEQVKYAAFAAFALAAVVGFRLAWSTSLWLVGVGLLCILGAWYYTGGKHPYGYRGLGEIAIFIFFGLVAVLGTEFTQLGRITWVGIICAVTIGALSASVNLVNNLRDIPTDTTAKKITLAVRLGDHKTRMLYLLIATIPLLASVILAVFASPWALLGLLVAPVAWKAAGPIRSAASGAALIPVLGATGKVLMLWAVITTTALSL
jgi:hypothetical protein